jgi:hypothetical protein
VLVGAGALTLADSGARVNDYAIRLGALDQYAAVCVRGTAPTTLVFDLSGSGKAYVFEDNRYGFPAGFAPSDSPFKLSIVGERTINVHFQGSKATLGRTFKYDLILRNVNTGERLILDPPIVNSPK